MSPAVLICPKCQHTQRAPKAPRKHIVEIELNGSAAWLTDTGLVVRERALAHRWDTAAEAYQYAAAHLDDRTVRHVRVA